MVVVIFGRLVVGVVGIPGRLVFGVVVVVVVGVKVALNL